MMRGTNHNLDSLTQEVEREFGSLLRKYGGRFVTELSSEEPIMDFATVVIEIRSLRIRAVRDRGDIDWDITGADSRYPWQPLQPLCRKIAGIQFHSAAQTLDEHLPEIERILAGQ